MRTPLSVKADEQVSLVKHWFYSSVPSLSKYDGSNSSLVGEDIVQSLVLNVKI